MEIFSNILNVFTLIFDQFTAASLNQSIDLFKKNLTASKHLSSSVYIFRNSNH